MALLSILNLAIAVVVYAVYQIIYCRYFHPLAKFPGPFWASITRLWFASWCTQPIGEEYGMWRRLHAEYGPIVRVTPTLLLVSDATKLPLIYSRQAAKSPAYGAASTMMTTPIMNIEDAKTHAYHRKVIAGSYSLTSVKRMEPLIDARIAHLLSALDERFCVPGGGGKVKFDFAPWASYMAYDVISEIAFGAPFGFVEQGKDIGGLLGTLHKAMPYVGVMSRLYPFFVWLQSIGVFRMLARLEGENSVLAPLIQFRDRLIDQRFKEMEAGVTTGRVDLLQSFLDTRNDKREPLSLEYIKAEMLFIIIAGADTTGTAFQSLLMHVLTNPSVYDKVMAEVDEATKAGHLNRDMPQFDEVVAHCPYYMACLREAMRLNPPVPAQFPRLAPEGGLNLDGRFIPEGAEVACNVWVVQHDARVYGPDVDVFRPERWLEDPARAKEYAKYSFVFGYGARQCLGRDIAYMELYKGPLQFLRTFRPVFVDRERPGRLAGRGDISFFEDMWMTLERREWPRS